MKFPNACNVQSVVNTLEIIKGCRLTHMLTSSYSNVEVSPSFFSIDGATGEAAGAAERRKR